MARYLLRKKAVAYLASDAHNIIDRRPELSAGLKVAEKYMKHQAINLVDQHPRNIFPPDFSAHPVPDPE